MRVFPRCECGRTKQFPAIRWFRRSLAIRPTRDVARAPGHLAVFSTLTLYMRRIWTSCDCERIENQQVLWKRKESTKTERGQEYIYARAKKFVQERKIKYTGFLKAQKWFSSYIFFLKTCIFVLPRCVSRWVTGTNPLVSRSGQLHCFRCQYTETSYVIQNLQLVMPIRTKCIFRCSNNGRMCWYIFSNCD